MVRCGSAGGKVSQRKFLSLYLNNPIRYIDPTGMSKEDWYLPEGGTELEWANNVTSQASIDNSGGMISGTYIGSSAYRVDENGNTISYNEDGTKTSAIQLNTVEVTPNTGKFDLAETVQKGSINLLGIQKWMDQGINNPQEVFQATGTAVYNVLIFESTFIGIGGSVKCSLQASNMFLKSAYAADTGISLAGIFDSMLGINSDLISKLNGVSGVFGIRNSIRENKAPALHDAHGILNTMYKGKPDKK